MSAAAAAADRPRLRPLARLRLGERRETPLAPVSGVIAWLVIFAAAAMSFLAVCAGAFGVAADRMADQWRAELARAATVVVSGPPAEIDARLAAALEVLRTSPGVAAARALDPEEVAALLVPWLGSDAPLDALPLPRLVDVQLAPGGPDAAEIARRLEMQAPGARYDDHGAWREPLLETAAALRLVAWGAVALALGAAAAMVTLAARATLASSALIVETLRLLGATNAFIARTFVRRYTVRAALGGLAGAALAGLALAGLPLGEAGPLAAAAPGPADWALLPLAPLICAAVAWLATRVSVMHVLRRPG